MERSRGRAPTRISRMMRTSGKAMAIQLIVIILFIIFAKIIDRSTMNRALETFSQQLSKNYQAKDFVEIGESTLSKLKTGTTQVVAILANEGKLTDYTAPTDLPGTLMTSNNLENEGKSIQFLASEELQVYAVGGGMISEIHSSAGTSTYIKISHGNDIYSLYGGCTDVYVQSLEKVRKANNRFSEIRG